MACGDAGILVSGDPSSAIIAGVEVALENVSLEVGDSTFAHAVARSQSGESIALVDFTWTSSDTAVAMVQASAQSAAAVVRSVAVGVASLTASAGGISSNPVQVTVVEPEAPDSTGN
jgi:hypothetical protein